MAVIANMGVFFGYKTSLYGNTENGIQNNTSYMKIYYKYMVFELIFNNNNKIVSPYRK